jgi:hypothetical protein
MIQEFSAYPDWKAPAEDSDLLIWPDPAQIVRETAENHRTLARWDSPLADLRRQQRSALKLSEDRPAIATGHQTELFHPGVWSKLAMIDAAARPLDADTFFAAIDTDAPKHLQLRWPGKSRPITDDARLTSAQWSGLLDAPSAAHVRKLKAALQNDSTQWSFEPMALQWLDDLEQQTQRSPSLSAAITASMYRLDFNLGLRHQSLVMSRIWMNEPYLCFIQHILSRAESFTAIYNTALAEYRQAHDIDNPGRPMPDLAVHPDTCEVPFWLDDLAQNIRHRAVLNKRGSDWQLQAGADALTISTTGGLEAASQRLGEFLVQHNLRLAPRALTLTMFLRLMVVDQFVHGIGGGRYEQVNNRVIQRFFNIEPPAFSVTTATLHFPAAVGRKRACVPCLVHEGHRLRHSVMGDEKMDMVRQIQSLPRKSPLRQQIFSRMRGRLAETVQIHPSIFDWQKRMNQALQENVTEQGMFDRELFYAIQPESRLRNLIARYQERFEAQ